MKTTPVAGRYALCCLLLGSLLLVSGCASKSTSRVRRAPPPVVEAETILRNQAIENRAHELVASGKYKYIENARIEAEKEIPRVTSSAQQEWSTEQARRQQQKEAQEKFQADFAKSRSRL